MIAPNHAGAKSNEELLPSFKSRYGTLSRLTHWFTVLMVAALFGIAWSLPEGIGPPDPNLLTWHVSIGVTVLLLTVLRLVNRLATNGPLPPLRLPRLLRVGATAIHWTLYAILIITPVLGFAAWDAFGYRATFYFFFDLPRLIQPDRHLASLAISLHALSSTVLLFLIAIHVLAAVCHFIRKDDVFQRMSPF